MFVLPNSKRLPLLTKQEEIDLVEAARGGDRAARDRLILSNVGLVCKIAKRYRSCGIPDDDLVQEGLFGLMQAIERFDPTFTTRFATYASQWVRCKIVQFIQDTAYLIRVPDYLQTVMYQFRRTSAVMRRDLGRKPKFYEVADRLGLSKQTRRRLRRAQLSRTAVCLDHEILQEAEPLCGTTDGPTRALDEESDNKKLAEVLGRLTERERHVVSRRFGLGGGTIGTLREIGDELGISRERVRQVELEALETMREIYESPSGSCVRKTEWTKSLAFRI